MTAERDTYAIFLNGGYGVGKSSVLEHVGDLLADAGRPFSLMDVDWFHRSWPPASHDSGNVLIEAENMAATWRNYLQAGPRRLVISGVISSKSDRDRYERALGLRVRSVRLEAEPDVTAARLRHRYTAEQAHQLQWHLERYEEIARQLRAAGLDEIAISTDGQAVRAIAGRVLGHFGLLAADQRDPTST